ncbi:MAG: cytochrome b/b6 domain-containing protein [Planctomycetota bacterium]
MSYPRTAIALAAIALFFSSAAPALAQEVEDCLGCHGDRELLADLPDSDRLFVDPEKYPKSTHGSAGLSCIYCHADLLESQGPHAKDLKPVRCDACHRTAAEHFRGSLHGYALARGNERAPDCTDCHGNHDILSHMDPASPTHKTRLPDTCAKCHGKAGLLTDQIVKLPESFQDYRKSVHGQGAVHGVSAAASCDDCHEVHDLRAVSDPDSPINPRNVSKTCGKCHPDIQRAYDRSIHGRALQAGVMDSPNCTDCHGEHLILSPSDPESKTSTARQSIETCGKCHDDPVIIAKYHLKGGVVGSYHDSYHGWATRADAGSAATCISCHTAHAVLPETDKASTVHPENVVDTCKQCHPRASIQFARSYTHETASIDANPINKTIRWIYYIMIAVVVGGMVLHNLVIMNYYMLERRRQQKASSWVLRFDRIQIIQHLALTVSFVLLVLTGFALRYPEAWWVRSLSFLGLNEPVRGDIHRFAAVLLILVGISHVWYVFFTRRGRVEMKSMLPHPRDASDMATNLKYHTWRTKKAPKFGRYDYSQKAEYWALIWGTALMVVTGFILWFPQEAVTFLPHWIVSASQTIHYYEAWLASLAILVWHFFFVIFHPEEYPMSWTWLTGKMSKEFVKHHHRRWYEEEVEPDEAEGEADETADTPDDGEAKTE